MNNSKNSIEAIIFDWVGTLYQFGRRGLFSYSEEVLKKLHSRYKLAVISKASLEDMDLRKRQILQVSQYFQDIVVEIVKTEQQFKECMERLMVKPENTLVVGDRMYREIANGNNLGCKTAWIQYGVYCIETPNKETGEPIYKINSVEDLLTIL